MLSPGRAPRSRELVDFDPVAAALLGEIERLVGLRQQAGISSTAAWQCTTPMLTVAPTGRLSTSWRPCAKVSRMRSATATALSRLVSVQHRGELLAAEAADQIGRAHRPARAASAKISSTRSPSA